MPPEGRRHSLYRRIARRVRLRKRAFAQREMGRPNVIPNAIAPASTSVYEKKASATVLPLIRRRSSGEGASPHREKMGGVPTSNGEEKGHEYEPWPKSPTHQPTPPKKEKELPPKKNENDVIAPHEIESSRASFSSARNIFAAAAARDEAVAKAALRPSKSDGELDALRGFYAAILRVCGCGKEPARPTARRGSSRS